MGASLGRGFSSCAGGLMNKNLYEVETPCYVVDEKRLVENLVMLAEVAKQADCKICLLYTSRCV